MIRNTGFMLDGERYEFDFKYCTPAKGWAQVDTDQDAWYYGNWANPTSLELFEYAEGDMTHRKAESEQEFVEAVRELSQWERFRGIDPMLDEGIAQRFRDLGLGDLLH